MAEHSSPHDEALIGRVVEVLRAPQSLSPDFALRVARAAARQAPAGASGANECTAGEPARRIRVLRAHTSRPWLVRPRRVYVSPLAGLGAAAAIAGIAVLGGMRLVRQGGSAARAGHAVSATAEPAGDTLMTVRFTLVAPGAVRVTLIGDFNNWSASATPLSPSPVAGGQVWSVSVPLAAGRHQYAFVVDGSRWTVDPQAPAVVDDYGTANSVITIPERAT